MIQKYFLVPDKNYQELELTIKEYNKTLRDTYDKTIALDEKKIIMNKKDCLVKKIEEILNTCCSLAGYFSERELEDLESSIEEIDHLDARQLLRSNCISNNELDMLLVQLLRYEENTKIKKLIFFIEKAINEHKSIIAWIM